MKVKIKKLNQEAKIPIYSKEGDAGFDLYTVEDFTVENLTTAILKTGIALKIPKGYYVSIVPRSGFSGNYPNYIANSPATIDEGYVGEILILFRNNSFNQRIYIPKHTRIAQGILKKYEKAEFEEVDKLPKTDRGSGRLGSTGEK